MMMLERNRTYYQQHPCGDGPSLRPQTLTVGELMERLAGLEPSLPVITRSPSTGCFGDGVCYAIGAVERETRPATIIHNPARSWFDEEEGVETIQEAYDDELPAWDGVVLA